MPDVPATRSAGEQYRRSPALVLYWTAAGPVCFDCITSQRTRVTGDVISFLDLIPSWKRPTTLARAHPELGKAEDVRELLEALVLRGIAQRRSESNNWPWHDWSPEAAFFHFATRMHAPPDSPTAYDAKLRVKARHDPPPRPTKQMSGVRFALPRPTSKLALIATLTGRRTWRRFSNEPTRLADLATLLHLTWGVQRWGMVEGQGKVALKTSPSGGARHSIEAYVLALNVAGILPGVYHYDAATRELVNLNRKISKERVAYVLATQRWFLGAGAIVVMSAVFQRAMWRYPFSRAYRAVLTEAGHLGQTFCLLATARGLAPFCTMAFRDRELEALIGLDGVSECAMYVVGVGTRPKGRIIHPGKIPTRGPHGAS